MAATTTSESNLEETQELAMAQLRRAVVADEGESPAQALAQSAVVQERAQLIFTAQSASPKQAMASPAQAERTHCSTV